MAGLAAALRRHERIGLDTPVFVYHIEGASPYAAPAGRVFEELANGAFAGVTSVLTLTELTVKPLQLGRLEVADEYEGAGGELPQPDDRRDRPADCAPGRRAARCPPAPSR